VKASSAREAAPVSKNTFCNDLLTPSLGKKYGRVVLKAAKQRLKERIEEFEALLEMHQDGVKANL